ncbi:MAG TPA: DUF4912 domain-containing protein [Treponema sp.]|nr:DUF4912 domain-containing protein [Treponema sp.]
MDDTSLTRVYLEGQSTGELLRLADRFGIDIPFGLERVFVIEALLETGFENEGEFEAEDDVSSDFLEAAALPKQYNISFIEVIIRDPLWAFVLWELKSHDREVYEKAHDFDGYCLRMTPALSKGNSSGETFTVMVGVNDTAWYLGFPLAENWYKVELCVRRRGGELLPLIVSRPFRLPRLLEPLNHDAKLPGDFRNICDNPLAVLSGANDFPVIRNADRHIRGRDNTALPV